MRTTGRALLIAVASSLGACAADDAIDLGETEAELAMGPEREDDGFGPAPTVEEVQVAGLPECAGYSLGGRTLTIFVVIDSGGLYAVAFGGDPEDCFCVDDREGLRDAGIPDAQIPPADGTPLPADEKPTDGTPLPAGGTGGSMVSDGTPLPASN